MTLTTYIPCKEERWDEKWTRLGPSEKFGIGDFLLQGAGGFMYVEEADGTKVPIVMVTIFAPEGEMLELRLALAPTFRTQLIEGQFQVSNFQKKLQRMIEGGSFGMAASIELEFVPAGLMEIVEGWHQGIERVGKVGVVATQYITSKEDCWEDWCYVIGAELRPDHDGLVLHDGKVYFFRRIECQRTTVPLFIVAIVAYGDGGLLDEVHFAFSPELKANVINGVISVTELQRNIQWTVYEGLFGAPETGVVEFGLSELIGFVKAWESEPRDDLAPVASSTCVRETDLPLKPNRTRKRKPSRTKKD